MKFSKPTKVFIWGLIGTTILIGIIFAVNSGTVTCNGNPPHINRNGTCTYPAYSIQECIITSESGTNIATFTGKSCDYKPKGFLDNSTYWNIFIISTTLGIAFLLFYWYNGNQKRSLMPKATFRPEDRVEADDAEDLVKLNWSRRFGIPFFQEGSRIKVKEDAFEVYNAHQTPIYPNEERFKVFQMDVIEGKNTGTFTITVSLNRGKDWILNGNYDWKQENFDYYKINPRDKPLYQLPSPEERTFERLLEINPEKALEYRELALETEINKFKSDKERNEILNQQQQIVQQQAQPPWYAETNQPRIQKKPFRGKR